ncbi:hypothetical protein FHG87_000091, partial [Trinorchestia longiramus]
MPVQVLSPGGVSLHRRESADENLRRRPDWRSVEDGLETDYGFLQYPSLQRPQKQQIWRPAPGLAVPYTRPVRVERPAWHQDDLLRTSTPLSPGHVVSAVSPLPGVPEHQATSRGITKRHSVLWKLKPERWRQREGGGGTLRRCRSRDDVLQPSPRHNPPPSHLAASHPDLVTSHLALPTEMGAPPAISILPPSRRPSSQTLPRRASHGCKDTLFARGRRWFASHRPDHKDTKDKEPRVIPDYRLLEHRAEQRIAEQRIVEQRILEHRITQQQLAEQRTGGHQLLEQRIAEQLTERGQSELTIQAETMEAPSRTDARKLRPRRPRTFYLLEDYLAPVRGGLELDECVGPRILFPPPRPAPPTPDWATPSLSPQPSASTVLSTPRTTTSFIDSSIVPSPDTRVLSGSLYSPVFSPRDTTYPRFVTPEMSLSEHPSYVPHSVLYPSGHVTLDGRRRNHLRNK